AAILHGSLDAEPARQGIVAVHHLAFDAERFAAIDDVLETVLALVGRGNAPAIVHDDHQDGQLVAGAGAPDHAGGEVAFGGAGVAANDDGDAVAAAALFHQRRARPPVQMHLDHPTYPPRVSLA